MVSLPKDLQKKTFNLQIMFTGEHRDRRDGKKIDCSKTIWIMATNALDTIILEFCQENEKILGDDMDEKMNLAGELSRKLKAEFLSRFKVRHFYCQEIIGVDSLTVPAGPTDWSCF